MTDNNSHTANNSSFPPSDWVETTLGDVCILINRGITPNYSETEGITILNQKCIRNWVVSFDDARKTTKFLEEKLLIDGDILINSTGVGTLGRVAQIKLIKDKLTADSHVSIVRPNQNKVDKIFLGYLLKGSEKIIEYMAEGSTGQTELSRIKLNSLLILLPPLPEQQAIASVLSAFDDKIELLREQNRLLEEMEQTIFGEWFGKYGVDDELPEGWRVGKLGEKFDITIGRTPPRAESQWFSDMPTGKKWISIKDIGNSGTYIFDTSEYLTDEAIEKFIVKSLNVCVKI